MGKDCQTRFPLYAHCLLLAFLTYSSTVKKNVVHSTKTPLNFFQIPEYSKVQ